MEKKNTGLIVLVVILSLVVIGLSGFIVYDKVLNTKENNNTNTNEETKIIDEDSAIKIVQYLYSESWNFYQRNLFRSCLWKSNSNCVDEEKEWKKLTEPEKIPSIKVDNYNETMEGVFTLNGIKQYEKKFEYAIKKENDNIYIDLPTSGEGAGLSTANLKIKSIEDSIITASVDILEAPFDENNISSVENIIIKKENGKWKMEQFPNRITSNNKLVVE